MEAEQQNEATTVAKVHEVAFPVLVPGTVRAGFVAGIACLEEDVEQLEVQPLVVVLAATRVQR